MHLVNATINSAYLLARTAAFGASLLLSSEAAAADIALEERVHREASATDLIDKRWLGRGRAGPGYPACFSSGAGSEARP